MRFSVQLHPSSSFSGPADMADFAQQAEALGYWGIHVPEHIVFGLEQERRMGATWWEPVVLATHLTNHTTALRVIFSIVVLPSHNPVRLAKSLATLDNTSGGRIDVGVGVGWLEEEFDALGVSFQGRGVRTEEYIRILRTLWTTHPCTFEGEFCSFHEMSFLPNPSKRLTRRSGSGVASRRQRAALRHSATGGSRWVSA